MPRKKVNLVELPLTVKEVFIYQEIYYEHYRPLMKSITHPDADRAARKYIEPTCQKYGWDFETFLAYKQIDFMQRCLYDMTLHSRAENFYLQPMSCRDPEMEKFNPNNGALRLKCPKRTSDPDPRLDS